MQRIRPASRAEFRQRGCRALRLHQRQPKPHVRHRVAGVEIHGLAQRQLGSVGAPLVQAQQPEGRIGLGQLAVQRQGPGHQGLRLTHGLFRGEVAVAVQQQIRLRQSGMGQGKSGVLGDRLFEEALGLEQ